MTQIRKKNGQMAITFGNDTRIKALNPGFDGLCSQLSWNNASLMQGLREMFGCFDNEHIVAIEVDQFGIKAKFERD